jgi:hypothetical protein
LFFANSRESFPKLDIPIEHLELRIRKKNPAAWSIVVRPGDDPGLSAEDFAPAGGIQSIGVAPGSGTTAQEVLKTTVLEWKVNKGPLAGCVVFLTGDKTFALKSHAEAYPN